MLETKEVSKLPPFVLGTFGQRLAAYLIDLLLIEAISSLLLNSYQLLGVPSHSGVFNLYHLTALFVYFTYFILLTKYNQGQTIGKMILGLRILSINHNQLSWSDVIYRELIGRYIQKKIKLLYLIFFLTRKKQTAADYITDTVVVSEKKYLDFMDYLTIEKIE